jgi:hypothetical protein
MSEHEHTEPEPDERETGAEDLEVSDGQQEDLAVGAGDAAHKDWINVD